MKKSYKITLLFLLFAYGSMSGQNSGVYSLEQCLAKGKCTYIMDVHNSNTRVNDLKNRLFRIRTLPKIRLYATLPNLVNTISPVTLYDGSEKFINRFYMSSSLSMSLSQFVPFTGGTVLINSGLTRLDNFSPQRTKSFNLNLFNMSYSQNVSTFNSHKWDKRIVEKENTLFEVSEIQLQEALNLRIVELFFDLYSVQKEIELNKIMVERAERLVERIQVLYENGKASEISVQSAKIDLANLRNAITGIQEARIQAELCRLLNLDHQMIASFDIRSFEEMKLDYDVDMVVSRALHYSNGIEREVEILQEQRNLRELRASRHPVISLSVGGGINSHAEEIKKMTGLKSNSFSALVSVDIPILSWRENKLKADMAEESARIRNVEYNQRYIQQEITYRYELINLEHVLSSFINDRCTLEMLYMKYDQVLANYEQGRVDYFNLTDTRNQIIQLEIERISKMKIFYMTVYNFRRYALYDIINNEVLTSYIENHQAFPCYDSLLEYQNFRYLWPANNIIYA